MLEDRFAQHDKVIVDKYHNPVADYTMRTYDYVLRPSASPATGAITITLPPVAEAKGRFYGVIARDADATNTITIEDNNNDSELWYKDIVMNNAGDRCLFYSDGLAWYPACSGGWFGASTTIPPGVTTAAPTTTAPTTAPQ
jgi:hypothetical protein